MLVARAKQQRVLSLHIHNNNPYNNHH
jgi:hypothetical protein